MKREDRLWTKQSWDKLDIFPRLCESLYGWTHPSHDEIEGFLGGTELPILRCEQREMLDSPIQVSEVSQATDKLKLNKKLGPDSFYKKLKYILIPKYCKLFAMSMAIQQVPPSWSHAHIAVILLKDRDSSLPQSCLSILLLNVDYKILSSSEKHNQWQLYSDRSFRIGF